MLAVEHVPKGGWTQTNKQTNNSCPKEAALASYLSAAVNSAFVNRQIYTSLNGLRCWAETHQRHLQGHLQPPGKVCGVCG